MGAAQQFLSLPSSRCQPGAVQTRRRSDEPAKLSSSAAGQKIDERNNGCERPGAGRYASPRALPQWRLRIHLPHTLLCPSAHVGSKTQWLLEPCPKGERSALKRDTNNVTSVCSLAKNITVFQPNVHCFTEFICRGKSVRSFVSRTLSRVFAGRVSELPRPVHCSLKRRKAGANSWSRWRRHRRLVLPAMCTAPSAPRSRSMSAAASKGSNFRLGV
jgi:hypothetical protein